MKKRRLSREVTMQILFQMEAQGIIEKKQLTDTQMAKVSDFSSLISSFVNNFYLKDKSNIEIPFVGELLQGTLRNLVSIDEKIDKVSSKWKIERMDSIDRAILRMSCYEIVFKRELSIPIVINEALEIAKRYGSEHSPAFINGILDSLH